MTILHFNECLKLFKDGLHFLEFLKLLDFKRKRLESFLKLPHQMTELASKKLRKFVVTVINTLIM